MALMTFKDLWNKSGLSAHTGRQQPHVFNLMCSTSCQPAPPLYLGADDEHVVQPTRHGGEEGGGEVVPRDPPQVQGAD